jgi:hypothetical protein
MPSDSRLVLMASYQAATSYVKFSKLSTGDIMLLDPALALFGEYFASYAVCHIVDESTSRKMLPPLLQRLNYGSIQLWSYALSDIGLYAANHARRERIPTHFMLPSSFIDVLHACDDFDPRVALKTPRALARMLLQKAAGAPIRLKTHSNYLFSCIDTSFAASTTTFAELSSHTEFAEAQFERFVRFVREKHRTVIEELLSHRKLCIMLDEDLVFNSGMLRMPVEEGTRLIADAMAKLRTRGYRVYLKPTYCGDICLAPLFSFDGMIPGEIPMEVLDLTLPQGTLVTGISSSFLTAPTRNLRTAVITQLLDEP